MVGNSPYAQKLIEKVTKDRELTFACIQLLFAPQTEQRSQIRKSYGDLYIKCPSHQAQLLMTTRRHLHNFQFGDIWKTFSIFLLIRSCLLCLVQTSSWKYYLKGYLRNGNMYKTKLQDTELCFYLFLRKYQMVGNGVQKGQYSLQ